jgi:PAS domain S-box-containing protein
MIIHLESIVELRAKAARPSCHTPQQTKQLFRGLMAKPRSGSHDKHTEQTRKVRPNLYAREIEKRKQAEAALSKSEEKFMKAFDAVPVAVTLVTAADGRQIEVNDALLRMTGYTRDEVIGRLHWELGYWDDPRDRQKIIERLLAGEQIRNVECRFRRKNREPFVGLLSAELIDLDGEQCIITATMDITNLRRAEQYIRALESRLAPHFEQTMFGVIEFDTDLKISEWNPAAAVIFGYKRQEAVGRDARDLIIPPDLKPEMSVSFGELLSLNGGRFSTNRNITKRGKELICEWFSTPLTKEDGTVSGVLSVVHDVTTEKHAESDLAASEAMLSAIFQNTEDTIWTVDSHRFGLMTFNSAFRESFAKRRGYDVRQGMTPDDFLPPERASWWKSSYRRVLETGAFETDYENIKGTDIFRLSFNPLFREGKVFGISVFGRNVTARRRAEQELQASLTRYQHLVASSNDWVWEVDVDGTYTYASPQCRDILGYGPEEMIGKKLFDLMPQEEAERVRRILEPLAAARRPFRALENTNLHKDGHLVVLETNGVPIIDAQGHFCGYRGMDRDITDRKQVEQALRESEGRLRLALESGRMYAFEWDPHRDLMLRSPECAAVLGIPGYPVKDTGKRFLNRIHRDDRLNYVDALGELTPVQNTYLTSYRELLPNGRTCWIEARGRGLFDAAGNLLRVIGIASDITVRKESEDALRQLSANLINAQEEERKRFARELHDGVSQALAVISIGVAQAARASTEADLSAKLERLYGKVQDVISDVGQLSHELHPSTLKHLGLTAAIRYLCRETSETHGIDIEFTDVGAPQSSSKETSLCLYRIAQEALQNIVKHSGAKKAWVELKGSGDEISLCIKDEGVGFDIRSQKSGLGLVSMRERLRLVAGKISISSRRNSGTRIEVRVPLAPAIKFAA